MGISRGNCSLVHSLATCSRARDTIAELAWEIPRDRRFSRGEKKGELNGWVGSKWRKRKTAEVTAGDNLTLGRPSYLAHCHPASAHTSCRSCWHGWACHVSLAACSSGPRWRPAAGWQCGPAWAPHNHLEQHWGPSFYLQGTDKAVVDCTINADYKYQEKMLLILYNNCLDFFFISTWRIYELASPNICCRLSGAIGRCSMQFTLKRVISW